MTPPLTPTLTPAELAFEEAYGRAARDPSNAEMLEDFTKGYNLTHAPTLTPGMPEDSMREEQTLPEMPEPIGYLAFQGDDKSKGKFFLTMVEMTSGTLRWHPPVERVIPLFTPAQMRACFNAGIAEGGKDAWQPIETAPKSSDDILLLCSDTEEQFVGFPVGARQYQFGATQGIRLLCVPDFWRPLPTPPAAMPNKDQK